MTTSSTSILPLRGGCQCGAVKFELHSWPTKPHVCHCRMCQKASGAPFMAFAELPLTDIVWTRLQPSWFRSSEAVERGFCSACGTSLHFRYVGGDRIDIALACLYRPNLIVPEEQVGCEGRLPWLDVLEALPASTTEASTPAEALKKYASRQHPDE
ncbi:GFA family protein [Aquisalimonas sp. 2447]|nr:GFA family protein [Aquisalimonas sp. 2447]QIT54477.1 GFA family protein [Aquisalimonas sp. 2447]